MTAAVIYLHTGLDGKDISWSTEKKTKKRKEKK